MFTHSGWRLEEIERSKYLGGDVEHTHLVKGLDFALLEKVKSDISRKEREEEERRKREAAFSQSRLVEAMEEEDIVMERPQAAKLVSNTGTIIDAPSGFRTQMGKSIYSLLFIKKPYATLSSLLLFFFFVSRRRRCEVLSFLIKLIIS